MTWKVPGYVVEELLGYGGSGEVWRGHASATGAPVALKRLPVEDAAAALAARAEAALLSTLDHPHLIRMHELVPVEGGVVLVLDLAGGGSLADLIRRRGRLTPGEVITALAPVGAALAYAHNEGVVHGDVTAANVLFTEIGLPLLADLGVARIVGDSAPARSTPAYVDPSVAAGCAPGAASDVFMLAAVAVHALTGTPIWTGVTPEETIARAAAGDTGDLAARLAQLPPDLAGVLDRALSIEPHLRGNAAEFALDLRHAGEPVPVELAAGGPPSELLPGGPPPGLPAAGRSPAELLVGGPVGLPPGGAYGEEAAARTDVISATPAASADPARPTFHRPGYDTPMSNPAQLTHGVRAALHAPVAQRPSRLRGLVRRPITRIIAIVVLLVLGTAAVLHWTVGAGRPAASPPSSPTSPTIGPTSGNPAAGAGALLRDLDGIREQAFAQRQAALLARVYVAGPLLDQDTALLQRVVPDGCGLIGVRTTYSAVQAQVTGGRLVLATTATLAPSTLTCAGGPSGSAAGERPTRLRIELVQQGNGYRIASQQKL
jgi:hypothetical protein